MIADLEYRVAELERRLLGIVSVGKVTALDEAKARVKVAVGGLVTTWLPWLTRRAGQDREWWAPEEGEQVVLLCPCGDRALGVVLPAIYQNAFPAPSSSVDVCRVEYSDGAVTEYNRKTHRLTATVPGDIDVTAGGSITATAPKIKLSGAIDLIGPVKIQGVLTQTDGAASFGTTLSAQGGIASATSVSAPSLLAAGKEMKGHKHNCPDGETSPPL